MLFLDKNMEKTHINSNLLTESLNSVIFLSLTVLDAKVHTICPHEAGTTITTKQSPELKIYFKRKVSKIVAFVLQ